MNEKRTAAVDGQAAEQPADEPGPLTLRESGILPRDLVPQRPSWEEVDAYVCERRHRAEVERYARQSPDFAEVLRWMCNEHDAESCAEDAAPGPLVAAAAVVDIRSARLRSTPLPPDRAHHS